MSAAVGDDDLRAVLRTRGVTIATVAVLVLPALPLGVLGFLLMVTGLPFALGAGVFVHDQSIVDSVLFGLVMVLPGAGLSLFALASVAVGRALLRRAVWAWAGALAMAAFVSIAGMSLILFGDRTTGNWGAGVLAFGVTLLSLLPLPSLRDDVTAHDPMEERHAL